MTRDPKSVEQLDVWRNDLLVGSLRRTASGSVFEYEPSFYEAHRDKPGGLATHLPFAQRAIETRGVNLHSYFAGLLPEGLRLRALISRVKTSEDDVFSLLVAAGSDCVGNLFPSLPGQSPPLGLVEGGVTLGPPEEASFAEVLERSLGSSSEPAIAGVQEKLSPSMISLPLSFKGAAWILKLNPPDRLRLVENEHFFMRMAASCGLDVAQTHLVHDRHGAAGLLVKRFDRRRQNRRWVGIHQEDGCQLLDRYPADKYRLSVSDLGEALARADGPLAQRARLLELVAFSYLIGNGDLHAKNVSVTGAVGEQQLSAGYDLLSTRPYRDRTLAMKFEGRNDNVKRRHFVEWAERYGVSSRAIEARLDRLTTRARPFLEQLGELQLPLKETRTLKELLTKRLRDLQ